MTAVWPYSNGAVQIRVGLEIAELHACDDFEKNGGVELANLKKALSPSPCTSLFHINLHTTASLSIVSMAILACPVYHGMPPSAVQRASYTQDHRTKNALPLLFCMLKLFLGTGRNNYTPCRLPQILPIKVFQFLNFLPQLTTGTSSNLVGIVSPEDVSGDPIAAYFGRFSGAKWPNHYSNTCRVRMSYLCDSAVDSPAAQRDNALASKCEHPPFCHPPLNPAQQLPSASVQRTRSTLAAHSAVPRGTNDARVNANRAIRIAAQRAQGLWGLISVFLREIWPPTNWKAT